MLTLEMLYVVVVVDDVDFDVVDKVDDVVVDVDIDVVNVVVENER
jgi:hypothetical protein